MPMKRVLIFLSLLVLCLVVSAINLNQKTRLKYQEFQWVGQAGDAARAEAGFRALAVKYPCTAAGIQSARTLVADGESPARLAIEILDAKIKDTSAAEWLVFLSAFFVFTFFAANNSLPSVILPLFVLSSAGMFHLSHPLISTHGGALDAFLAVNPYLYTALTLLIAGGCLHHRRKAAAPIVNHNSIIGADLTLSEQILARKIYSKRLKTLQERAEAVEGKLRSPHGRGFVKEVRRIHDNMLKQQQTARDELASIEAKHRGKIQALEETIERAKWEVKESRILLRTKAVDCREYKRIRLEKASMIKEGQLRISEIKALEREMKSVRFISRLQLMRRNLFLAYLHRAFIDRKESAIKGIRSQGLFDPKVARNDLRNQKILYRKSSKVDGKIEKLKQRREKMKGLDYKDKMRSLLKEKKKNDKTLTEVGDRISRRMEMCKNKLERLENATRALTEELADMKTLGRINGFFPSLVRVQTGKIRRAIKFVQETLPVLQKIDKIYNGASP